MSDNFWIFMLIPIVGVAIGAILNGLTGQAQIASLQSKFVGLGNLKGKTFVEISDTVGQPNASTVTGNQTICTWTNPPLPGAPIYSITLIFTDGICAGIAQEQTINP